MSQRGVRADGESRASGAVVGPDVLIFPHNQTATAPRKR